MKPELNPAQAIYPPESPKPKVCVTTTYVVVSSNMDFSTCFRDPFEALKPGLISYYLPTPPHMAENTEGSPDSLGLALKGPKS